MSKTIYLLPEKGLPFPPKGSTFFEETDKPFNKDTLLFVEMKCENHQLSAIIQYFILYVYALMIGYFGEVFNPILFEFLVIND